MNTIKIYQLIKGVKHELYNSRSLDEARNTLELFKHMNPKGEYILSADYINLISCKKDNTGIEDNNTYKTDTSDNVVRRKCLKCGDTFIAESVMIRVCNKCKRNMM